MSDELPLHPAERSVIVRRQSDGLTTLCGRDLIVMPLDKALDALLVSSFMREWLKEKMLEHLERGYYFVNRSQHNGAATATYQLATEKELMDLAVQGKLDAARRTDFSRAPRRSGKVYKFTLPPKGANLEVLDQIKGQGRTILQLVAESGRDEFTVEALEALLEAGRVRLKTKPDRKLLELFRFHMSESYKKFGLLEVIEAGDVGEEDDEAKDERDA